MGDCARRELVELSRRVCVAFVVFPRPLQRMPRIVPLGAVPLAAANLRPPTITQLLKRKCIRSWRMLHSCLIFGLGFGGCLLGASPKRCSPRRMQNGASMCKRHGHCTFQWWSHHPSYAPEGRAKVGTGLNFGCAVAPSHLFLSLECCEIQSIREPVGAAPLHYALPAPCSPAGKRGQGRKSQPSRIPPRKENLILCAHVNGG